MIKLVHQHKMLTLQHFPHSHFSKLLYIASIVTDRLINVCIKIILVINLKLIEHLSPADHLHFATVMKVKSFLKSLNQILFYSKL